MDTGTPLDLTPFGSVLHGIGQLYFLSDSTSAMNHSPLSFTNYFDASTGWQVLVDNASNTTLPSMRRNVIFDGGDLVQNGTFNAGTAQPGEVTQRKAA